MVVQYPAVDGKLSQVCYLKAVDDCYNSHLAKLAAAYPSGLRTAPGLPFPTIDAAYDHVLFHSPYNKLVQQSYKRMLYNDARRIAAAGLPLPPHLEKLAPFAALPYGETLANRDLDKALAGVGGPQYDAAVGPTVSFSQQIGNSYTAALWTNLLGTVDTLGAALAGRRLGMFSYGSGALATMFAVDAVDSAPAAASNPKFTLAGMKAAADISARLAARKQATPEEFTEALAMRERSYGKSGFTPAGSVDNVPAGGWYLKAVDGNHVREYARRA